MGFFDTITNAVTGGGNNNANQNTNANTNANQNQNTDQNVNANANQNTDQNSNNQNTDDNSNTNQNQNQNVNTNTDDNSNKANGNADQTPSLDSFASLWQPNTDAEGNVVTPDEPAALSLDQDKLKAAIAKSDFSGVLTPENLAAITAGGEGAAEAFTASLNSVAQQASLQTIMVTQKLIEHAMGQQDDSLDGRISGLIKQLSVHDNLAADNPALANPAVKPLVSSMETQLRIKFPEASPAEITKQAQQWIIAVGEAFNPNAGNQQGGGNNGNGNDDNSNSGAVDWDKFLMG